MKKIFLGNKGTWNIILGNKGTKENHFGEHSNLFSGNKGTLPHIFREVGNMYPPWEAPIIGRWKVAFWM